MTSFTRKVTRRTDKPKLDSDAVARTLQRQPPLQSLEGRRAGLQFDSKYPKWLEQPETSGGKVEIDLVQIGDELEFDYIGSIDVRRYKIKVIQINRRTGEDMVSSEEFKYSPSGQTIKVTVDWFCNHTQNVEYARPIPANRKVITKEWRDVVIKQHPDRLL